MKLTIQNFMQDPLRIYQNGPLEFTSSIWKRNAILGADVAIKAFGGKPVMDEINA